jgi:hypothetical protein
MASGQRKPSKSAGTAGRKKQKTTNRPAGRAERIGRLLSALESRIDAGEDLKVSVADYIRLLQLQKEYEQDAPKHIEVTWVESVMETDATDA